MKKLLSFVLVLILCLSLLPMGALADDEIAEVPETLEETVPEIIETEAAAEIAPEPAPEPEPAPAEEIPEEEPAEAIVPEPEPAPAEESAETLEPEEPAAAEAFTEEESSAEEDLPAADAPAPATDGTPETLSGTLIRINPLYADLYEAGLLEIPEPDEEAPQLDGASIPTFSTNSEAGVYMREQMKLRNTSVTFAYTGSVSDNTLQYFEDVAFAHTGVPDEGDYLAYQCGGYSLEYTYYYYGDYYVFNYTLYLFTTAAQEAVMTREVANVIASLDLNGKSEYKKIRAIYDYVMDHVEYDYVHVYDDDYYPQYTAYAALISGTAVCQGYAVLIYRLMLEAGIDCRIIAGIAGTPDDYGPHAWNIVKLRDYYYYIDATWDDGYPTLDYFLKCGYDDHAAYEDEFPASFFRKYPIARADYNIAWGDAGLLAAGVCGDNLSWTLTDDTLQLTISGTGDMYDLAATDEIWRVYCGSILSVVLPDGLTSIGENTFKSCYNLTSIEIPDSVTSIGDNAFSNCRGLTGIVIPDSVTSIGDSAFFSCTDLRSVTIPDSVTSIGSNAFSMCSSLTSATLSASITSIEADTFEGCSSLTSITIPGSVTSIGDSAFSSCAKLAAIALPDSVTDIGVGAFSRCTSLKDVTLPVGLTSIGNNMFNDCASLTSVDIPDTVTSIGSSAFFRCTSLTSITIPNSVTSIGNGAFYGCSSLTSITIPAGVTSIGNYAFTRCLNLTSIEFEGHAPAIDNSFGSVTATAYYPCGDASWTEEVMQNCGGDITWAKKHDYTPTVTAPTCTEPGWKTGTCTICGEALAEEIPALGHDYAVEEVPPTCTGTGSREYTCVVCGYSYTETLSATGHTWGVWTVTKAATGTEEGERIHACTVCGTEETEVIPMLTGEWVKVSGKYRYQYSDGSYAKDMFIDIGDATYYIDASGYLYLGTNWLKIDGVYYYFKSGARATGLQYISGAYYFFNDDGTVFTGWLKYGGATYFYDLADGKLVTGLKEIIAGPYSCLEGSTLSVLDTEEGWYYFDISTAKMYTGLLQYNGSYYLYLESGLLYSGWLDYGGARYYYDDTYKLAVGFTEVPAGEYNFLDGTTSEKRTIEGGWYYFSTSTAKMVTGWVKYNGYYFYADPDNDGRLVQGTTQTIDDVTYTFNESGVCTGYSTIPVNSDSDESTTASLANPWTDASVEEIERATGFALIVPDGVEVSSRYMAGMAEASWNWEGVEVTERISCSDAEPAMDTKTLTAFSGIYFTGMTTQSNELVVGGRCPGYMEFCRGDLGAVMWYDEETGLVYTVSFDKTTDPKNLGDTAEWIISLKSDDR